MSSDIRIGITAKAIRNSGDVSRNPRGSNIRLIAGARRVRETSRNYGQLFLQSNQPGRIHLTHGRCSLLGVILLDYLHFIFKGIKQTACSSFSECWSFLRNVYVILIHPTIHSTTYFIFNIIHFIFIFHIIFVSIFDQFVKIFKLCKCCFIPHCNENVIEIAVLKIRRGLLYVI